MANFWIDELEALSTETELRQKLLDSDDGSIFKVRKSLLADLVQEIEYLRHEAKRNEVFGL